MMGTDQSCNTEVMAAAAAASARYDLILNVIACFYSASLSFLDQEEEKCSLQALSDLIR